MTAGRDPPEEGEGASTHLSLEVDRSSLRAGVVRLGQTAAVRPRIGQERVVMKNGKQLGGISKEEGGTSMMSSEEEGAAGAGEEGAMQDTTVSAEEVTRQHLPLLRLAPP
mmetsp:Transcript_10642/g.27855  ORF Transcript_10642/g.27855 Transcript_10642/m.27855 type:complete len:110 (-) Transcript_10642:999-1328(-)